MAHECPDCGQLCYCDMEDHEQSAPDDCTHDCPPETEQDEEYICTCFYVDVDKVDASQCELHGRKRNR